MKRKKAIRRSSKESNSKIKHSTKNLKERAKRSIIRIRIPKEAKLCEKTREEVVISKKEKNDKNIMIKKALKPKVKIAVRKNERKKDHKAVPLKFPKIYFKENSTLQDEKSESNTSEDNSCVIELNNNQQIRKYPKLIQELPKKVVMRIRALIYSRENKIYAGGNSKFILVYKMSHKRKNKEVNYIFDDKISTDCDEIRFLAEMLSTNYIISCGVGENFEIWDNNTYQRITFVQTSHTLWINKVIETNRKCLLSASDDGRINIYDHDFHYTKSMIGHPRGVRNMIEIKNNVLVTGSWDRYILFWDLKKFKPLKSKTTA